jgi:hypothetical protein
MAVETTTCGLPSEMVGPYNQTLFLGCSIVDFNCNLGWGGDSSTLAVTLVQDLAVHPYANIYKQNFIDELKRIKTENDNQTPYSVESTVGKIQTLGATNNPLATSYVTEDANKNLHANLIGNILKDHNDQKSINQSNASVDLKDFGKVYYDNLANTKKYWTDVDPGFLGTTGAFSFNQIEQRLRTSGNIINYGFDLVGSPAFFKFGSGFNFGGIITSWRKENGNDGIRYSVEMKNFSTLLSNSQLIIGHYAGSIFNLVANSHNNITAKNLGVPGPTGLIPSDVYDGVNATMSQGNTANVFNILGYIERAGFGLARENENGIPAYKIYNAIQELLNPGREKDKERDIVNNNLYSPYGGIVCKSIGYKKKGEETYTIPDTITTKINSSTGDGNAISLEDMGVLPTIISTDTIKRSVFRLDISEVPIPPNWLRIKGPVINLMQFITELCDGAGFDFYVDFEPNTFKTLPASINDNRKFSGTIKIKTVSRRTQPEKNKINKFLDDLNRQGVKLTSYSYGQEYNDNITRTMYIGGKQKRLIQYKSKRFHWKQHSLIYDPFANNGGGSFMDVTLNNGTIKNHWRMPSPYSYRSQNIISGANAVIDFQNLPITNLNNNKQTQYPLPTNFKNQTVNKPFGDITDSDHRNVLPGNYKDQEFAPDSFIDNKSSIPLHEDIICPYFGKHFDGSIRRVFYDRKMNQMQILFKIQDLLIAGNTISFIEELTTNNIKHFVVLENEIRAAGVGFEEWLSYCFDNGFYTDIERLVYRALYRKYGNNASVDIGSVHKNLIENIRSGNLSNGSYSQFGYSNMVAYGDEIYATLENIHKIFNKIASEYYGKSYMISLPNIKSYTDLTVTNIIIGYATDALGNNDTSKPIYALEGSGKTYQDIEISTDGAWEEPGNFIDNAIVVGSAACSSLTNDSNMIQPILGFNTTSNVDGRYLSFWQRFYGSILPRSDDLNYWYGNSNYINSYNINKAIYLPMYTDTNPSEYVDIQYDLPQSRRTTTVHNYDVYKSFKTYIKCAVDPNIEYLQYTQRVNNLDVIITKPRAIVNLPSPVYLSKQNQNTYNLKSTILQDTFLRLITKFQATSQDIDLPLPSQGSWLTDLFSLYNFNNAATRTQYGNSTAIGGLLPKINTNLTVAGTVGIIGTIKAVTNAMEIAYIRSLGEGLDPVFPLNNTQTAEAYDNPQIMPKAALPTFCALPITFNQYVYGPWINYPSLIASGIFNEFKTYNGAKQRVENLIGGVKVEVDDGLVPWNYGSMTALDENIMLQLANDVNYQQEIESATIQIGSFPNFRVGHILDSNGPIVNHIGVQIGSNGISTTLNFRTYLRKFGLFNKENAERLKQINLESIKRNKEINAKYNELRQRISEGNVGSDTSLTSYSNAAIPKVLKWSPVEILVGAGGLTHNKKTRIQDYHDNLGYNPGWHLNPYCKLNFASGFSATGIGTIKQQSRVTLQDFREAPRELKNNYANKSFMSLDGIISPVSFFPTPHGSTYHMTKYDTRYCPICRGTKTYTYNYLNNNIVKKDPGKGSSTINSSKTQMVLPCDFCEIKKDVSQLATVGNSESTPPYILANDTDAALITQAIKDRKLNVPNAKINYTTLNPVVLSNGEFLNSNRQSGDVCGHSIDAVAFGNLPSSRYGDGLRSIYSDNIEEAYNSIDTRYSDYMRNKNPPFANGQDRWNGSEEISNNHRFFALRGPLMLHAWGYDTEGYPVPNAGYEPKLDAQGNIVRKTDGTIVTKSQVLQGNRWTDPVKEHAFYKGWAQLPSSWPVGPIDLRWDHDAKVWTFGGNYKPVFVVLEEDLTDVQPVRGAILDNSYSNNPLPSGLRKLVFVKDNKGMKAPRGAQVYCKYSTSNGFYEPIYVGNLVTSGVMITQSTARIFKAYSPATGVSTSDNTSVDSYETAFKNPLKYQIAPGNVGLFNFINGSWVLQNASC